MPAPLPAMSAEEFRLLRDLVEERSGLHFAEEMKFLMERRLEPRVQLSGRGGYRGYYLYLRYDPRGAEEMEQALEVLTNHETYFFREERQLLSFRTGILPELCRGRARPIRIWSAGCSTGEEPYTVAILAQEAGLRPSDVEIVGVDISRKVLDVARRGVYHESSFRTTTPVVRARWFHAHDGGWEIEPSLRRAARFVHANLLHDDLGSLGCFHVAFCRNVMIYFDRAAKRRLAERMHDALADGGYLLLGHAESLMNVTTAFEVVPIEGSLVYRKPHRGGRPPPSREVSARG